MLLNILSSLTLLHFFGAIMDTLSTAERTAACPLPTSAPFKKIIKRLYLKSQILPLGKRLVKYKFTNHA